MNKKSAGGSTKSEDFPKDESRSTSQSSVTPPLAPTGNLENLGELPRSYGVDTIFLVAQEPHWLFTYWDIDITRHPGGKTLLRVYESEEVLEAEIEVPFETRNWYIPVTKAGSNYAVEIGYYRGDVWNPLARSVGIQTPPEGLSESDQFDYATIPFHVSFQNLMENVQTAVSHGEPLAKALARLQKDGKLLSYGVGSFPNLPPDERLILEALLGADFLENLSSENLSSEQIEVKIRERLQTKLDSQGASELLSKIAWTPSSSSLFSALGAFTSGETSSWSAASLTSWTTAALSSWATATLTNALGSSAQSSWGRENLGSWPQAAAATSSWAEAAQSSWPQAATSSWGQAGTSSWAGAATSSWSQGAISSWMEKSVSSWFGASENVSSFGLGREFFMHVNAEVIFYGGTHPDAQLTIDGKPVKLNPDGTFRCHFIFPNDTYEIPIVATSPDGVETRSATLRFERGTNKTGYVTDTAQPPLGVPPGSRS
jgi:hypothetical protein